MARQPADDFPLGTCPSSLPLGIETVPVPECPEPEAEHREPPLPLAQHHEVEDNNR